MVVMDASNEDSKKTKIEVVTEDTVTSVPVEEPTTRVIPVQVPEDTIVEEDIPPVEKYYKLCRGEIKMDSLDDEDKATIIYELRETKWYVDPMPVLFPDDEKGVERKRIEKLVEQKELAATRDQKSDG